jgi:tight adherence protein B
VVAEITFIVLAMIAVLAIILGFRAARERREKADKRLVPVASDSEIGLEQLVTITPPPVGALSRFDNWFDTAVRRSGLDASPAGVVAVMVLAATALGTGLYLWKGQLGLIGLGIAVGVSVPLIVVALAHRRYRWRLQEQIPDAYRMLAGSVRAGQTLEQAIEFYSERGVKPLAEEFAHCSGLIRLGMSPLAALQSTAPRIRLLDFDLLVSTVGLYTQTGGNLVLLLERLADSVRDRNLYLGQFYAATAQSRVVALAIGSAAPIILVVYALSEPEHIQTFFNSRSGWAVLMGCALLEILGVLWLYRILKVEY